MAKTTKTRSAKSSKKSKPRKNEIPANEALKMLKAGNKRFVTDKSIDLRVDGEERGKYVNGQWPYAIVVSCADSRVLPEVMFNTGMNELFVIRVAGNIANTSSVASIEYAVAHIQTKLIVVLGHRKCGAVDAAMKGGGYLGHNLNHLLSHISPAMSGMKKKSKYTEAEWIKVIKENAKFNAGELRARSAIISDASDVTIVPAYYDIESGKVEFMRAS